MQNFSETPVTSLTLRCVKANTSLDSPAPDPPLGPPLSPQTPLPEPFAPFASVAPGRGTTEHQPGMLHALCSIHLVARDRFVIPVASYSSINH